MLRISPMLICAVIIMIAASLGLKQNFAQPNGENKADNKAAQNNVPAQGVLLSEEELKQFEVLTFTI